MHSIKGKEIAFQTLGKNFIQDTLKASEHIECAELTEETLSN